MIHPSEQFQTLLFSYIVYLLMGQVKFEIHLPEYNFYLPHTIGQPIRINFHPCDFLRNICIDVVLTNLTSLFFCTCMYINV